MEKYGNTEKNYDTIPRSMELRFTKVKKHCRFPKKLRNFYLIWKVFEQIYSFRNLIDYGKTMVL